MIKEFKIRCSALASIMAGEIGITEIQKAKVTELSEREAGNGKPLTPNMVEELKGLRFKQANPQLPEGAKTYVKKWLKMVLFNERDEQWKSVVIEKGLQCELDGIALIADVYNLSDLEKCDEYFENEFMQGSPDMIHDGVVRDSKLSWDIFTFPMFETEIPKIDYWWQLQGYMILSGFEKASIDYCLIDTPMALVLMDLKKLYYQSGGSAEDWTQESYEALYPNYRFDDIPKEKRVKSFTFELENGLEDKIKERVLMCRKYIETLLK